LPATVSVAVVAAMLLFPYATGYELRSDPLWRLLLMLWNASVEWKHGMFVFPIAAVLLFLKRTELAKVPIKGSDRGLLLIVPSLFLYWVGFVANVQYIGYLAIQLMLGGCVIWFLGVRFFKAVFFIWCFLFFAYPFIFLEDLVAFPLRLLMSEASVRFLNLIGFPSIRDGTAIVSAADPVAGIVNGQRYSVDVADPCSGIRSLFALTMFSALVGIFSFRPG
jgi:exosortase